MSAPLGRTGPPGHREDYELVELLPDVGGQAFVFRAVVRTDRLGAAWDGAHVAVKQSWTGALGADRQEEVVDVLASRSHPHLGKVLEAFLAPAPAPDPVNDPESAGNESAELLTYLSSPWVPGRALHEMAASAPLPDILRWVAQIAGAVDYLHHADGASPALVYRDIKPANVIVTPAGDAVLIDPGLVRRSTEQPGGLPHGSPGYVPPECDHNPAASGPAGDRWQVGALLYAALVGDAPGRSTPDRMRRELEACGPVRADPVGYRRFVDGLLRMLDPDPDRRPASAAAWAAELRTALPTPGRRSVPVAARGLLVGLGSVAALLLAGFVGYNLH